MIDLTGMTPAAEQGWLVLFELAAETTDDWLLVGGQMMLLSAAEHEAVLPRSTDDVDIVVDVRSRPKGTQWLADWLQRRNFELDGASAATSHGSSTWIYPGPDSQRGRRRRSDRIAQRPTVRSTGRVRRPNLLGALVIKAAALTEIATRTDPARDWQDASLLLSVIPDPVAVAQLCTRRDRRRLQGLTPLLNRSHVGWATLTEEHYRRGAVTLDFLVGR